MAWHEVNAHWRRQARAIPGEIPEQAGGYDPAVVIEDRLAVAATAKALARLSAVDRYAVVSSLDETGPPGQPLPAAEKMRRSRARRRLAAELAGWLAEPDQGSTREP